MLAASTMCHAVADNLHGRIDEMIAVQQPHGNGAATASDPEFLRRIYLDLAGRIPTADEAKLFLADTAATKRTALVEGLLAGPDYPRRMQELFHVMLMERRGNNEEWTKFLRTAFEQNLPWHQMAAAMLKPDADNESLRGAAFFQTQRLVKEGAMAPVDVPGLTRDVGRLFAGIDLQCAQCHNHLTVEDYSQQDFQGLHMVFENVDIRTDVKFPAVGEKVMIDQKEFSSVFEQIAIKTGPVIPGAGEVTIEVFEKGDEFEEPPDPKKKNKGVPRFSPLRELSTGLAVPENKLFCRNIVNRLWFAMMGRGLVEPLDLHHSENAATHPELLELLAHEFAAHEFNIRWLLRELALTQTYQRSSTLLKEASEPSRSSYAVALEKRISAEQLFWSMGIATGEFTAIRRELQAGDSKEAAPQSWTAEQLVENSEPLQAMLKQVQKTFGNSPKEPEVDFTPSVAGALYLMHSEDMRKLLTPRPGNLIHELDELDSDDKVVALLFLTVLTRSPTEEERLEMLEYLAQDDNRRVDNLANITWALLTSTEFIVNH